VRGNVGSSTLFNIGFYTSATTQVVLAQPAATARDKVKYFIAVTGTVADTMSVLLHRFSTDLYTDQLL
jgi:hypothetical protein